MYFSVIYIAILTFFSAAVSLPRWSLPLLKEGQCQRMGIISNKKSFDHPFPSHLSTNKLRLAEILYILSTFANIAMPFKKSIS